MTTPILPGATGGLAEALNILLDKGLVIDASIKVTVIGIEVLTIEVKVIIASVDTYIRYLEAMQRLELARLNPPKNGETPPPQMIQGVAGTYGLLPSNAPIGMVPVTVPPQPAVIEAKQEDQ